MKVPERRDVEFNEVRWWSRWARLRWHGDGYLLSSEALREPFFNRAGALSCRGVTGTSAWAERRFVGLGMNPTLVVFASCGAVEALLASGYARTDTMSVLVSKGPAREGGSEETVASTRSSEDWTATYLKAFYGGEGLARVVEPIVASLLKDKAVTLLESRVGQEIAGVLALFRTPGLAGVYCVGSDPAHRRRGVATGLLAKANRIAVSEKRSLILQSLASDGSLPLYSGNGFEAMYDKLVLEKAKMTTGALASEWISESA